MQGARRRCRWCCRKPGNEPHHFLFSNEEIRHLCEAICLICRPPRSFDIFDGFNFFDLDVSGSGVPLLKIQRLTAPQVWCGFALSRVGRSNAEDLAYRWPQAASGDCGRKANDLVHRDNACCQLIVVRSKGPPSLVLQDYVTNVPFTLFVISRQLSFAQF